MEFSIYCSNDFAACRIKCERCFFRRIPYEVTYDLLYPGVEGRLLAVGKKLSEICSEGTEIEFYGAINPPPPYAPYVDSLNRVIDETKRCFDEAGVELQVGLHVNIVDMLKPIHERARLDWVSVSMDYKQHEVRGDTKEDAMGAVNYAKTY